MATSGKAFAISLGIYGAIFLGIMLGFSFLRIMSFTRKFYAPRKARTSHPLHAHNGPAGGGFGSTLPPSPPIRSSFLGWIIPVLRFSEADVLYYAGADAAMYLRILRFGVVLFSLLTVLCCASALPINLTGGYLDFLTPGGAQYAPNAVSPFTFWINASDAAQQAQQAQSGSNNKPISVRPPKIYNESIPDPPPGIIWWQYLPDVPPLPPLVSVLGQQYERYGWRYDDQYTAVKYTFTDLDKTTMANIAPRSPRLYGHAVLTWMVTGIVLWRLWVTCKEALRLRQYHLLTVPPGVETHSVLVTDVPGVLHGTVVNRLSGTMLRLLPAAVRKKALAQVKALKRTPTSIMKRMMPDEEAVGTSSSGVHSKWRPAGDQQRLNEIAERSFEKGSKEQVGMASSSQVPIEVDARVPEVSSFNSLPGSIEEEREEDYLTLGGSTAAAGGLPQHAQHAAAAHVDRWTQAVRRLNAGLSVSDMVEEVLRRIYGNDLAQVSSLGFLTL